MLDGTKTTLHAHPSLLPLRMALIAAERESPSCPRMDANEQRALQLIARMQAEHKRISPFWNLRDIPEAQVAGESIQELVGMHVG